MNKTQNIENKTTVNKTDGKNNNSTIKKNKSTKNEDTQDSVNKKPTALKRLQPYNKPSSQEMEDEEIWLTPRENSLNDSDIIDGSKMMPKMTKEDNI